MEDPRLLIMTIGYLISALINLSLAFFVLFKNPRKGLHVVFFLMNLSVATFQISHAIGINIADPILSRNVFMFNVANIFLSIFIAHWIFYLIGKTRDLKPLIITMYTAGIALFIFYIVNPDTFLLESVSKLYIPSYYEPGPYQWIMRVVFNIILPAYFIYELFKAYKTSTDPIEKNRFKYVFAGVTFGFVVGSAAILLVYDIPFDPMWSLFFGLYPLPFAYSILKYDLMDIKVVAKRALVYSTAIAGTSVIIIIINVANDRFVNSTGIPYWLIPLFSACVAVAIAGLIRRRLQEVDILKYEFITVVTHKFRTPLTYIKWAVETLATPEAPSFEERKRVVQTIQTANIRLVELTNMLVGLSKTENNEYLYQFSNIKLSPLIDETVTAIDYRLKEKKLNLVKNIDPNISLWVDEKRIKFVFQIVIDNAVTYTTAGSTITITAHADNKYITVTVQDNGIGIAKEELPYLFTKFFRGEKAKTMDTEGMGIGLYIAKDIVERNGGSIWAESNEGQGTNFFIKLKAGNIR